MLMLGGTSSESVQGAAFWEGRCEHCLVSTSAAKRPVSNPSLSFLDCYCRTGSAAVRSLVSAGVRGCIHQSAQRR